MKGSWIQCSILQVGIQVFLGWGEGSEEEYIQECLMQTGVFRLYNTQLFSQ